jgi:hypothetical protein
MKETAKVAKKSGNRCDGPGRHDPRARGLARCYR